MEKSGPVTVSEIVTVFDSALLVPVMLRVYKPGATVFATFTVIPARVWFPGVPAVTATLFGETVTSGPGGEEEPLRLIVAPVVPPNPIRLEIVRNRVESAEPAGRIRLAEGKTSIEKKGRLVKLLV